MTQVAVPPPATARRSPEPVPEGHVRLTIDGVSVIAPKGELVIRTAERIGTAIPRFCDHPLLEPVGACRQCLVEVEMGGRPMPKPQASCTQTVADGMVVKTQLTLAGRGEGAALQPGVPAAQPPAGLPDLRQGRRVPAAEPDHGQRVGRPPGCATRSGCSSNRSRSPPRSCWTASGACCASAAPGSPTRSPATSSSTCWIAAPRSRSASTQTEPFQSYFSGNTIQICPVGALTSAAYRFRARPFDLVSTTTVCEHCAGGCALRTDHRAGAVTAPAGPHRPGRQRGVELRQGPVRLRLRPASPTGSPGR